MPSPDYSTPAEVYAAAGRGTRGAMLYRRFGSLAEAIKFVIEDMPKGRPNVLAETEAARFNGAQLQSLYEADDYPLRRASKPRSGGTA